MNSDVLRPCSIRLTSFETRVSIKKTGVKNIHGERKIKDLDLFYLAARDITSYS